MILRKDAKEAGLPFQIHTAMFGSAPATKTRTGSSSP